MATEKNKIVTEVILDGSQAEQELDKLNKKSVEGQSKFTDSLKDSGEATKALDSATGGLGSKLSSLQNIQKGVAAGFRTIGGAIALSGIGLLVLGVVALTQAFTRSEEGQNKFAKIMATIGAVTDQLLDGLAFLGDKLMWVFENPKQALSDFGASLKKNITNRLEGLLELVPNLGKAIGLLFKGKFSEAGKLAADTIGKVATGLDSVTDSINNAAKAIGDLVDATLKEAQKAAQIADQRAQADKLERNLLVARAKADQQRAELLEKAVNKEKFSLEDRISFLQKASDLEIQITNQEIAAASIRLKAKQAENALGLSNKEALDEEAQLKANLINLETARLTKQKEVTAKIIALKTEEANQEKAAQVEEDKIEAARLAKEEETKKIALKKKAEEDEANATAQLELDQLEIERLRLKGENTLALELELLERKRLQDVAAADLTAKEIQVINEKAQLAKDKLNAASKKAEMAKEKAIFDTAVGFAADSFGIAQEVAIAKMIMAAPEAIAGSFKEAAKKYAPPLSLAMGALGATGTVAPIIKGLKDIKKTRFSKSKGSTASGNISSSTSSSGAQGITPEAVSDIAANNASRLGTDIGLGSSAGSSAANNVLGSSSSGVVFSESKYNDFKAQVAFKEDKTSI